MTTLTDELNAAFFASGEPEPDPPRWCYFQRGNGPMFCWTVEKDVDSADADERGWYYAYTYRPTGTGARSGKAQKWTFVENSLVRRRKRKDVKAIALKRFEESKEEG